MQQEEAREFVPTGGAVKIQEGAGDTQEFVQSTI